MNIMWSNLCNNVKICTPLQSTKSKFVESTSSQFHATTLLPYALKYKFTPEDECLCVGWSEYKWLFLNVFYGYWIKLAYHVQHYQFHPCMR